jgi:hypothetical protein
LVHNHITSNGPLDEGKIWALGWRASYDKEKSSGTYVPNTITI